MMGVLWVCAVQDSSQEAQVAVKSLQCGRCDWGTEFIQIWIASDSGVIVQRGCRVSKCETALLIPVPACLLPSCMEWCSRQKSEYFS